MIRNKTVGILSKKTSYDIWIGENLLKQKNKDLGLTLAQKKVAVITDKNESLYASTRKFNLDKVPFIIIFKNK